MKNVDKYVGKFLKNSLEKSIGNNVPLKEIYNEYKVFMLMNQVEPKLYKNFRLELMEIFNALSSVSALPSPQSGEQAEEEIKIKKMQDKYYVVNVKLIGKNILEFASEAAESIVGN